MLDDPRLSPGRDNRFLSSPECPDWLQGPPSFIVNRYMPHSLVDKAVSILTTHLQLVPKLRVTKDMSPLPYMPSWDIQGQLSFFFWQLHSVLPKVSGINNINNGSKRKATYGQIKKSEV